MFLLSIFFGILIIMALFFIWIYTAPIDSKDSDALVILGYQCKDNKIHPLLQERLYIALELIKSHKYKKIIISGGKVNSTIPEAELMKGFLLNNGVEKEDILIDDKAMDTIDNIINVKHIMKEESLNTCIIISNLFHIRRLIYIANTLGMPSTFYAERHFMIFLKQLKPALNEIKTFFITASMLKKLKKNHDNAVKITNGINSQGVDDK